MALGFVKVVTALTLGLCFYVLAADRPFSYFFPELTIDNSVIKASVVNVLCSSIDGRDVGGSGTIISTDGVIITNSHVIPQNAKHLLTIDRGCIVTLPTTSTGSPEAVYWAHPIVFPDISERYDLAYLRIYEAFTYDNGQHRGEFPRAFPSILEKSARYDQVCPTNGSTGLGDPVRIYGYPETSGGSNLTLTDGIVSSIASNGDILTSAKVDAGNSGGLAVDKRGCIVGIPVAVSKGEYQNLGVLIPMKRVLEFSDDVTKIH